MIWVENHYRHAHPCKPENNYCSLRNFGSSGLSVLLADEGIFRLMEGIGFEFEEVIIPEAVRLFLKRPDFIVGAFQGAG